MATIDLTGKNPISESFTIDPNTGFLTLTISANSIAVGQLIIEKVRIRAFAEALAELSKSITTDLDARQKSRMMYDVKNQAAQVNFG